LPELTGEKELGSDPEAWLAWWERNRSRYEAPPVVSATK